MAGSQINPIDVNFHLQKCLEIFDENSADKIWSYHPSCQLGLTTDLYNFMRQMIIILVNFQFP